MKNLNSGSKPIDTVLFDFDGTLADTMESSLLAFESTLLQFHYELPKPITMDIYGAFSIEGMFRCLEISDSDLQSKIVLRYNELYREIAPGIAGLFPGVRFTLNLLKDRGFRLAIATNELRENLDMLLKTLGIDHIFDTTCCADEVKHPKPWPEMGWKVIESLETTADKTLMVGDSVCDIEMAQHVGMSACAVSWGCTPFQQLIELSPEWAITDFIQLVDILQISHPTAEFQNVLIDGVDHISETVVAY
jgi:HAD superfamily hydrolase (TIGR01509 family)